MNPYLEALGFLGLLCGLSVVCDRLMSKEGRKEFGGKLRSKIESREMPKGERWGPIALIDALPPFSLRSVVASVLISMGALAVIFYVQYFLLEFDFSELTLGIFGNHEQRRFIILFSTVFIGNFVADYISFTQTLIILGMIKKGTSKASAAFIFVTDLLASINIFTFVYAFFFSFSLYYMINYETRAPFIVSITEETPSDELMDFLRKIEFNDETQTKYTAELFHLGYGAKFSAASVSFVGPKRISHAEIGDALLASMTELYPDANPALEVQLGSVALDGTKRYAMHDYQLRGSLSFWLNARSNFIHWYSAAYLQSDEVQDQFFEVATLTPGLKTVDYVRYIANNIIMNSSKIDYIRAWCESTQKLVDIANNECKSKIAIISTDITAFRSHISMSSSFGGQIPLYTFFFTSLTLTLFIYCLYASMHIIKAINLATSSLSMPVLNYLNFEEHPMTVLSFPFNVLCSLTYLWFALD